MSTHHWNDQLVWQKAHKLVTEIYFITNNYPESEKYNLTSQLRRASTPIPTNIVEGHERGSNGDFLRSLYISRGSLEEVRYLLFLSKDLKYIADDTFQKMEEHGTEVSILINKLIKSLKPE